MADDRELRCKTNSKETDPSKKKCLVILFGRFCVLENKKHINRHIKMHQRVTATQFIQEKNNSEVTYSALWDRLLPGLSFKSLMFS